MNIKVLVVLGIILQMIFGLMPSAELHAASRFRIRTTSTEMQFGPGMTIPARDDTVTIWLDKDRARRDDPNGQSIIFDRNKGLFYILFHKFDVYGIRTLSGTEVTDTTISQRVDFEEGLAAMRETWFESKAVAVDSVRRINGFLCHKYVVSESTSAAGMIAVSRIETWATEEISIDKELYKIIRETVATGSRTPNKRPDGGEVKGFKVLQLVQSSGSMESLGNLSMKNTEELLDYREMEPPPGYFEIPKDYEWYMNTGMK